VPLLGASNQKLGEADPQEYFKNMADIASRQGTLAGLERRLRDCMIPGNINDVSWSENFSTNNFENFCRKRAELIISRVQEIVGDSIKNDRLSEDDMIEEDEG